MGFICRHPQLPLINTSVFCIGSKQYGQSRFAGRTCNQLEWVVLADGIISGRLIEEEDDKVCECALLLERSDTFVEGVALLELLLDVLDA